MPARRALQASAWIPNKRRAPAMARKIPRANRADASPRSAPANQPEPVAPSLPD
jgi:hypothetical protein